ncbi:efflux RND transporter periplasmic adaptor subunit [Altererythrobacter xixiisoli]|uniref:Efflux RND transporter periplasmic adaptor subunit n=1 Tax=Croceibacterium xixiisoli TaxID=1476466 RepID=A0A6I4TT95_9SPHN|nr:efflux RND transporter periplasmic adaptor subunit [Croceibacterium xixiisoli]MXO98341.1 efflux RND transporter periplasmic adaptor subunit [Croceibacterium xixiisoli]
MIQPRALRHCLICVSLALVAACSKAEKPFERPASEVGFVVVSGQDVPITTTLPGRAVAYETSEVRPQITGLIQKRLFQEGDMVRAGQPLYQVDARLYRAAVNQASANLASARANAEAAGTRADRLRPLAEMEAVSQQDYTDATAQARVARATVAQNQAALETARINLGFATIPAPITGRIGRSLATVGALVSSNQADPLAVIQRVDPMFVDIQQSSAELTALRQSFASGDLLQGSTTVRLLLEDGSTYPITGTVEFSEVVVNPDTGSITLRARFSNPNGLLLPGMFVRAVFEQAIQPGALLIPQPALLRDFDGSPYVFVVGADNKVQRRKISTDRTVGTSWIVTAGLKVGDKVITQGLNNLRDGATVRAVPASSPQRIGPPPAGQGGAAPSAQPRG